MKSTTIIFKNHKPYDKIDTYKEHTGVLLYCHLVVFTLSLCDNVGLTGFVKREVVPVFGFMSANPFVSLEIGR